MRDIEMDGIPDEGRAEELRSGLGRRLSAWAGALTALAVIGGSAYWAYGLGTRDPGRIPVIAAMQGTAKERIEDDGVAAAHQDIQSYAAAGTAAVPGEVQLAPPPPRPAGEDMAMGELEAMLGIGPAAASPALEPAPAPVPLPPQPAPAMAAGTSPTVELAALNPATGDAPQPVAEGVPVPGALSSVDLAAEPPRASGPVPPAGEGSPLAPAGAPAAPTRPFDLARRMAAASKAAVEDRIALSKRAADSPVQIQLGAFLSELQTREQWQLIRGTHAELLHNRMLAIQTTRSGGQLFYRLRVGPFDSRSEAASLCQALEARGQTCIVARNG